MANIPMKTLSLGEKTFEVIDDAARNDINALKQVDTEIKTSIEELNTVVDNAIDDIKNLKQADEDITDEIGELSDNINNIINTAIIDIQTQLNNKLGKTENAISATKATQDGNGRVISTTYSTKTELSEGISQAKTELSTEINTVNNKLAGCWISFEDEDGNLTDEPYIHYAVDENGIPVVTGLIFAEKGEF